MAEISSEGKKSFPWVWVVAVVVVVAVGVGVWYLKIAQISRLKSQNLSRVKPRDDKFNSNNENTITTPTTQKVSASWKEGGVAISGSYADADVVDLGDGKLRMYYSVEPEVKGNNLEIYSATSTDGITWTKEEGTRKTMATFPDVIKLVDGSFRLYFQNAGVIKSALSKDGLTFTDEPGVRIAKDETGFDLENVGAQTTTKLDDGSYIMVYRGMINQPYQSTDKLPNQNTQLFFYAISTDGLNFTKKGVAIDSRNETLLGLTDGAEWVKWDPSTGSGQATGDLRVYFWSYKGVYHVTYKDGQFSQPTFDFTNSTNSDPMMKFPQNPPGDPTLVKIGETWFMYYGQHTKGIYYATLKK